MLMKRDEGEENRPSREELEGMSFDDLTAGLADGAITRAKAIKLAGAALLGGALTVLWADEADARNKKKRRRRRRRRRPRTAQVTPNPVTSLTILTGLLGDGLQVFNPGGEPLVIGGFEVLDLGDNGLLGVLDEALLPENITIAPNTAENVVLNISDLTDPNLVNAEGLRLVDASGTPITVVDSNGVPVTVEDNGVVLGSGFIDLDLT